MAVVGEEEGMRHPALREGANWAGGRMRVSLEDVGEESGKSIRVVMNRIQYQAQRQDRSGDATVRR